MNNISIQRLFRIQGGIFPNRSRLSITVNNNKISCSQYKNVYIGNTEHMTHFLFKRLGITEIEDLPKNVEEYNIHIIEMYVPYWLTHLIEKYSVDEFKNRDKTFPKLVDKTTPGQSYQMCGNWTNLLKECCIFAEDHKICKEKDIYDILLGKNLSKINEKGVSLNINVISDLLYQCQIKSSDIDILEGLWNLGDIRKESEKSNDK